MVISDGKKKVTVNIATCTKVFWAYKFSLKLIFIPLHHSRLPISFAKEQMAHLTSTTCLIFGLVIFTSVISKGNSCELSVIGGGCPDLKECTETCRPCYRGIGEVHAYCVPASGGIPYDQCVCRMMNGAPCNPAGPPICPRPWPPTATIATNHSQTHNATP
ncbi:hypothetical protein JHK82_056427 [Glycine max]|nr:hypothetical protein JHK87_056517 [Glycine soja]KAG5077732.1 hypothetical protein JHK82_056427 [Glycine max]KHN15765.1 hypothetical protein glysoja_012557 [Glycine soja]